MVDGRQLGLPEVIAALAKGTREGRVTWSWDEASKMSVASLNSAEVLVGKDRVQDTFVTVRDHLGNTLDHVDVGAVGFEHLQKEADELYFLARRNALQVDSTFESLLEEIS